MRLAAIDVGSNTVLLLIAEITGYGNVLFLKNLYRVPRIGRGVNTTGSIERKAIDNLISVLSEYKLFCDNFGCESVLVKATAAMRKAENSSDIIYEVLEKTGLKIEIIDGETEARLSFLGAISTFDSEDDFSLLDIGGASTEIIAGNINALLFKHSFPFGAVNLTEDYLHNYPYSSESLKRTSDFIQHQFDKANSNAPANALPIAIAGTPTSLSAIKLNLSEYIESEIDGSVLTSDDLDYFIDVFKNSNPNNLEKLYPKFLEGRADIILAGTIILKTYLDFNGLDKIYVSSRGLRHGIILDYLNSSLK